MTVKVQKAEWEALSADDQKKIQQIISSNFDASMKIIPDVAAAAARDLLGVRQLAAFNLNNPICTASCGIAEAAAVSACAVLPPPLNLICIAAAHQAGDYCRSQC